MKVVIFVVGVGICLCLLMYIQFKLLIFVVGKLIIFFIIDQLIEQGICDFIFVIGYLGEKIKNFVDKVYFNINWEYIIQEVCLGFGYVIWMACDMIWLDKELVVFFGDVIFDVDFEKVIKCLDFCLCVKKVDDLCKFGVVEYGQDGWVKWVVEKLKIFKLDMVMVGFYKIKEVE